MSVDFPVSNVVSEKLNEVKTTVSVVPWYNAVQFKKVYQYLYSADVVKKRWALDQISVWETRCHPSLPAAIEASYGLTSAIVQDILWTNGATVNQLIDIQYIYSSAITRFVNLTIEIHEDQMQTSTRLTMSHLAKGLGIPSYIIDLRNEASHSVRPALSCLRIAAEDAMKYLEKSYWEPEVAQIKNHIKKPMDQDEIKKLLFRFIRTNLRVVHNEDKMSPLDDSEDKLELKKCLTDIEELIKRNKRLFLKVLGMDAVFIPLDEDMKFFVSEEIYRLFQDVYDQNSDDDVSKLMESCIIPDVPRIHEALWHPIIQLLNQYDAVPLFFEILLKSQGDRTVAGQKLIIAWVMRILRIHSGNGNTEDSSLTVMFKRKGMVANWLSFFYSAVVNPCIYTPFIFPLILCHLDLSQSVIQHFMQLVAIYLGQVTDERRRKKYKIFTVKQFLKVRSLQKAKKDKLNKIDECIWSRVTDDSHKTWPVGYINNSVEDEEEKNAKEEVFEVVHDENKDLGVKFFLRNENDREEDYYKMEIDSSIPDTLDDDEIIDELSERQNFLYRK